MDRRVASTTACASSEYQSCIGDVDFPLIDPRESGRNWLTEMEGDRDAVGPKLDAITSQIDALQKA